MEWDVSQSEKPCGEPIATYGPYACKAIPKIVAKELNGEPLLVFSGGLPRANYGDKFSVSVIHGENNENHVALDFTSKVSFLYLILLIFFRNAFLDSTVKACFYNFLGAF